MCDDVYNLDQVGYHQGYQYQHGMYYKNRRSKEDNNKNMKREIDVIVIPIVMFILLNICYSLVVNNVV